MPASYDPTDVLQVRIAALSPHTFAYKLWIAEQGATEWTELTTGDDTSGPFVSPRLYPTGTHFAYTLLIGGNPNTNWKVQVTLAQKAGVISCSPQAESGVTSGQGDARVDTSVRLA